MRGERDVVEWGTDTDYCHHGIPLSNGLFGALVWFIGDDRIAVTVNRADYWDHRGGFRWTEHIRYDTLKTLLQNGDFAGAKEMFRTERLNGKEKRPTRLPMGRFELKLREPFRIVAAGLRMDEAEARVDCQAGERRVTLRIAVHTDRPVLVVRGGSEALGEVETRPAFEFPKVRSYFDAFDIAPGRRVADGRMTGWVQELPADPACAVLGGRTAGGSYAIAAVYGDTAEAALAEARRELAGVPGFATPDRPAEPGSSRRADRDDDDASWLAASRRQWEALWGKRARVHLPGDRTLETMYDMGLYRMMGASMPGKVAPTLQGPWVEETDIPPWSCDYHFNINVQQCLWPAYAANLLECLDPLLAMIASWKERLADNARYFVGIEDGYMLNHSTDDRGHPTGGMWTGTIDHANTSWVAQLMWQRYAYTMDESYLLEHVYPFMKRAMNVYIAMMERTGDGYALPVTVSPEFGGSGPRALGRNSSFFLANVHFLCEKLIETAKRHKIDADYAAKLADIQARLPLYTAGPCTELEFSRRNDVSQQEIYLWEGQPLDVSHRHHSHLAGLYPFDVIDLRDDVHRAVVRNSIQTWVDKGMGRWAGWSMPWASILHSRVGHADMAYLTLKLYEDVFMMPGYAARHNGKYPGFTQFAGGDTMQLEAAVAVSAAVLEMFVQCVRGTVRVFAGLPERFRDASFTDIRTEGAFLMSGERKDGRIAHVQATSERGGALVLANPYYGKETAVVSGPGGTYRTDGEWIRIELAAGETARISGAGHAAG